MKLTNIILGVVCALVIALAAFLYVQKGKADRSAADLAAELAEQKAAYDSLAEAHQALQTSSGQMAERLQAESDRARAVAADLARLQQSHSAISTRVQQLSAELRNKAEEVDRLAEARRGLISRFTDELRNREVQITQMGDSLSMELVGGILFDSGQVELNEKGMEAIRRVGEAIRGVDDKLIRIEGHTDNVPVRHRRGMFESNWEISAARATNVVRFLIGEVGLPPERFEAAAMGEYHPVADNSTPEGREKNRRIVIKFRPLPPEPVPVPPPALEPMPTVGE